MLRDNLLYVILGLVAVVLIGITIGLQLALMSNQTDGDLTTSNENSSSNSLSNRLATALDPLTPTAMLALTQIEQPVETATAPSTSEPPSTPTPIPTVTPVPTITPLPTSTPPLVPQANATLAVDTISIRGQAGQQPYLNTTNLIVAPNEQAVLNIVRNDPLAIGVVGQTHYRNARQSLRTIKIGVEEGSAVEPSPDVILDGSYPFVHTLYLYTTVNWLREKPEVSAFIGCYLSSIRDEILGFGFFPPNQSHYSESLQTFNAVMGRSDPLMIPTCTVENLPGTLNIAGNTTFAALNQHMAAQFVQRGYTGNLNVEALGIRSGIEDFCKTAARDIIYTDRQMNDNEIADCHAQGYEPVAFAIGEDALLVVVSNENEFIDSITIAQLEKILTVSVYWSDLVPDWPNELIQRIVAGHNIDTLAAVLARPVANDRVAGASSPVVIAQESPTATPTSIPTRPTSTLEPTSTATVRPTVTSTPPPPADYVFGYIESRRECTLATQIITSILERWGWNIRAVAVQDAKQLFQRTAHDGNRADWFDITLCYVDPDDRINFFDYASNVFLMGNGYTQLENKRLYVMAHAGIPSTLEYEDSCLFEFLKGLTFQDVRLDETDAEQWAARNTELLEFWGSCEGFYQSSVAEYDLFRERD